MAEFKKFSSQGSFSRNQLKAPDEVSKIKEATARRIRGMNQAQAFLEKIKKFIFVLKNLLKNKSRCSVKGIFN